tara:strand:- start:428 stop:742 length:315 start_codon:yes stop_codon:yes gene_type:complete
METNLDKMKSREIMPGCHGKVVHGKKMTWVFWDIDQNAIIPEHNHPHEQIMHVVEGTFEFTFNGIRKDYGPGSIVHIPSNIYHSGKAVTKCKLMDVFSPTREEY